MSRIFNPRIFIDLDDSDILHKAGFGKSTVGNWRRGATGPERRFHARLNQLLGRDVLQPKPVAPSNDATVAPKTPRLVNQPASLYAIPRPHIEVNPCIDDAVCLAVRKAAMQPTPNTLMDQRREIVCMNCREGIRRARVEAANYKPTHGEGPRYCADPDCSRVLSYGAKGDHCNIHKISRRGALG